jgi:glyceraldehyde-3-phosphate dehydrogenase (NAD(P))
MVFQVHNEAVTVPEIIDCIRAMTGIEIDSMKSIEKTNRSLGIVKSFLPHSMSEEAEYEAIGRALEESQHGCDLSIAPVVPKKIRAGK